MSIRKTKKKNRLSKREKRIFRKIDKTRAKAKYLLSVGSLTRDQYIEVIDFMIDLLNKLEHEETAGKDIDIKNMICMFEKLTDVINRLSEGLKFFTNYLNQFREEGITNGLAGTK